ncbi:MAG: 3-isopropylmalate dehydratase small subunit [Acidobacteriota bacterium]|nr:3-isopropylmalate dehydratase small subunit [Acidobacteriota bacterium]MDE3044062.1 3-isopropylmalate dehydratase small subunit [Acidobacteriota bacterium]MDE3107920.1 3-isopropylmalate dehydratase small subunit [Acidobacteriota bacterium]MDE3222853.1 3-isopropylmalate dehydratase small subunit [Acidobacteriota bacterium]
MKPVHVIEGRAVPLERSDVDTDQIIPSEWLKRVERTGFGRGLFSEWRDDTNFVLNQPQYAGATILVAGPRFGTGSSREHAVWALMDYGFSAIIAPSFGDIFRNNASKQGLVIVQLAHEDVNALTALVSEWPERLVVVDVEQLVVEVPDASWRREFTLDPMTRERLLNGWDDVSLTLLRDAAITTYEAHSLAPTLTGVFDEAGRAN